MKVALNGRFIPAESASIAYNDRGLLLADGLFETMLSCNGRVFFLREHWERLTKGASFLKIPLQLSFSELEGTISELLRQNDLTVGLASLRLTLTRGVGGRGLTPPRDPEPTILLTCLPFKTQTHPQPASLYISSIRRNESSPLANLKSLCYLENILARQEALQHGFDEGILLNTKGNVAEASAANIFLVDGSGVVLTPALTEGALPGIVRAEVFKVCRANKIEVIETVVTTEMLFSAAEIFLTNSLIEIQSANMINGRTLADELGKITAFIRSCYQEAKQ